MHLAFAFDIGDEIDLDRARLILQGEPGQLPRRRRTPGIDRYRPRRSGSSSTRRASRLPGELVLRPAAPRPS